MSELSSLFCSEKKEFLLWITKACRPQGLGRVSTCYPQCVKPSTLTLSGLIAGLLFDSACDLGDLVINRPALFHELTDFLVGIHHCCVVAVTK